MPWIALITALMPLLEMLLKWLLGQKQAGGLNARQKQRLNTLLGRFREIDRTAVGMGCAPQE